MYKRQVKNDGTTTRQFICPFHAPAPATRRNLQAGTYPVDTARNAAKRDGKACSLRKSTARIQQCPSAAACAFSLSLKVLPVQPGGDAYIGVTFGNGGHHSKQGCTDRCHTQDETSTAAAQRAAAPPTQGAPLPTKKLRAAPAFSAACQEFCLSRMAAGQTAAQAHECALPTCPSTWG